MTDKADYDRGHEIRTRFAGKTARTRRSAHTEIEPDFDELITEVVYGKVWSRSGLDLRTRSAITIAALAALGRQGELRLHIGRGLNSGLSKQEISEILIHMAMYAGFPAAVSGFEVARQVFEEQQG